MPVNLPVDYFDKGNSWQFPLKYYASMRQFGLDSSVRFADGHGNVYVDAHILASPVLVDLSKTAFVTNSGMHLLVPVSYFFDGYVV